MTMKNLHNPELKLSSSRVGFPYKGGIYFFRPDQIIRLQSDSNYTYIYTTEHKPILMAKVLADYEALLTPLGFIRVHRSHLVNRCHVSCIEPQGVVIMDDDSVVAISRRRRSQVIKSLVSIYSAA